MMEDPKSKRRRSSRRCVVRQTDGSKSEKSSSCARIKQVNPRATPIEDENFDFSTHNESDLALLASLDDVDWVGQYEGGDVTEPIKTGKCNVEQQPLFSPEQDLFHDKLSNQEEKQCDYNLDKEHAFNDSLSDIFFRPVKEHKETPESNTKSQRCESCLEETFSEHGVRQLHHLCKDKDIEEGENVANDFTIVSTSKTKSHRSTHGTCLKEKLKQKLKTNVGVTGVKNQLEEDIRQEAIAQAQLDASQIRKDGTCIDIGPFYGLPAEVQRLLLYTRGISKLYDWQEECLQLKALKDGSNLIYSLPTSGGKTLVAEILMLREILCHKRDALFVLPFVSIVQEKVRAIAEFAIQLGFIVEEYAGSKGGFPPITRREKKSLYIATIEKAHSLVNSLIETERINGLGLIVVDELHMIGEGGSRGSNLEALLLKTIFSKSTTQIIGMSATLNNIADLQQFLCAHVYCNNFRPVPLTEFVKIDDHVFRINHQVLLSEEKMEHEKIITFPYSSELVKQDPDHLLGLVMEIIPSESCLVFCSSKKNCENVALMLGKLMAKHFRHLSDVKREKRKDLLRELSEDGGGNMCPVLEYTVQFGLGYHHSGLTMDERKLIEEAYAEGTLCLLTCTSTLAAGVNLPAKRVILRSPYVGMSFIKHSQYKQMVGRAGRAGIDSSGESFLIVSRQDRIKVKEMLSGPQDVCHSSLSFHNGKGVEMLLLSAVGLKMVSCTRGAFDMIRQSLFHIQSATSGVDTRAVTIQAIQRLVDLGLLIQTDCGLDKDLISSGCYLKVSFIGRATFKGSLDHFYSCQLYQDLKTSESSLNLSTYLHLLFLVTPYETAGDVTPSWDIYFKKFCSLSETETKVASAIGVPESYLALRAAGRSIRKKVCILTVNRFYLTLMLWDLWRGQTVWQVAEVFSQTRGFVQNLLSQAGAFASCVLHYCQELEEFWAYQVLLEKFVKQLAHCVSTELLPLMEVPGIKLARAKQLYAAGYRNVSLLATADAGGLVSSVEFMSRRSAVQIISAAKNIIEERRAALLEEVHLLIT